MMKGGGRTFSKPGAAPVVLNRKQKRRQDKLDRKEKHLAFFQSRSKSWQEELQSRK